MNSEQKPAKTDNDYDVAIIGGGGAGLMCAAQAGKRGRRVLLLDHSEKIGRKILISGGGRCNFTNIHAGPDAYVSKNPHFCKSALARYTPENFIQLVRQHRIAFHEKKLGQLFCDKTAQSIVDMLVSECRQARVHLKTGCKVESIRKDNRFFLRTNQGEFVASSLVVATGGLSIPQIGATGFGYDVARQFGLAIVPTAPALDGFVFSRSDLGNFTELSGVSVDSQVTCNEGSFRENILFTHTGLSGPASLQASLYWSKGDHVHINLVPGKDMFQEFSQKRQEGNRSEIKNLLAHYIPKRLAEKLCDLTRVHSNIHEVPETKLRELCDILHDWRILPGGTVGYKKAEVTRGGVDTDELSSKTMESRKVPGLYFIGEVVDVTGWLGGYNFQWAWASAYVAGQHV